VAAFAACIWGTVAVNVVGKSNNPFIGPKPFMIGQALYGRDWETRMLFNLLLSKRLVLLHSPSGAGKTSLIHAGLWPRLEDKFRVRPPIRLDAMPDLNGTPVNRYVYSTYRSLDPSLAAEFSNERLNDYHSVGDETKPELWIFDQFEEVLSLDPIDNTEKRLFFEQLAEALEHSEEPRWALFVMREDYLGALEPYLKLLPTGLSARFRLELLDPDGARQAIQKPAAGAGLDFTEAAACRLVDDLRQVRVDRPRGSDPPLGPYIEPVQLQVVCRQLWEELPRTTTTIDEAHVAAWGDVNRALSRYYEAQVQAVVHATGMDEVVLRDWFDKELITERGFRDQTSRGPGHGGKRTDRALQLLTDAHVIRADRRRDVTWYELAHDRLLEPVQTSNRVWRQKNPDFHKREAKAEDRHGRSANAGLHLQTRKRAVRRGRWILFLTTDWLRRSTASILINFIVAAVFFLAWWFAGPPVWSSAGGLAAALVAGWFLSILPGWVYLWFLRDRIPAVWDEYVLNLHQLAWDRPRHLPKPPVNSSFFTEWSNDGGDVLADQVNIYRQKFDASYGKSVSRSGHGEGPPVRIEALFPVFLTTAALAVSWTAVLWSPSFTTAPASFWDVLKFGFLGAYAFILQMLVRRFFQGDLMPAAYANALLRLIVVLILVAALYQILPQGNPRSAAAVAFVIGFFPLAGVAAIQRFAATVLRVVVPSLNPPYPLNQIDGLSVWYEARLLEEGIEDMQSLATANFVDVILHTRVPVGRLVDWVDQAHLYLHLDHSQGTWRERKYVKTATKPQYGDSQPQSPGLPAIAAGSVTGSMRAGSKTRTALRQLGIRTATDLLKAFPATHVAPGGELVPGSPWEAYLAEIAVQGLDRAQLRTIVRVLDKEPSLAPVWNWQKRGVHRYVPPEPEIPVIVPQPVGVERSAAEHTDLAP
jgi:hypothetical protein